MGTSSKITEKKIRRKIRWGAYVVSPLLTLGILTLLLQLFFSPFSSDFMNLNFDLGKLWPWATAGEKTETVMMPGPGQDEQEPILNRPLTRNSLELLRELNRIKRDIRPREVSNVNRSETRASYRSVQFDQISIKPMEIERIENIHRTFGRINLTEKEYLVSPELKVNRNRFAIGVAFAPAYSYRTLSYRQETPQGVHPEGQSKVYRNNNDQPILNFYAGVDLFFNVNPRLSIQSGLYYSSIGEQLYIVPHSHLESQSIAYREPDEAFAKFNTTYESPETVEQSRDRIPFNNYYGYLEIPLLANYRVWKKGNVNLDVQGGFSYTYLNHVDAMVYDFESDVYYWISKRSFELLNRHNANAYLGVAVSQYITPNVEIFANPQFRMGLRPTFNDNYPVKQHQYSGGVRLGMKVNL